MNLLYDVRDWFYECDRFLFLAEVHYLKENVIPSEHQFSHELTSSQLEGMLSKLRNLGKKSEYCINSETWVSAEELSILKETLDNISSGKWDDMDGTCIIKAQEIIHKLANAVNADIVKTTHMRGYPPIYSSYRIG